MKLLNCRTDNNILFSTQTVLVYCLISIHFNIQVKVRVYLPVSSRLNGSESSWHRNGEYTEQMYSKHLSIYYFFTQTA